MPGYTLTPKDVHSLISRICLHATLNGNSALRAARKKAVLPIQLGLRTSKHILNISCLHQQVHLGYMKFPQPILL